MVEKISRRNFLRLAGGLTATAVIAPRLLFPEKAEAALGEYVGLQVAVPNDFSEIKVKPMGNGEPGWFHPIYDESRANEDSKWVGVGPHYPEAFNNLTEGAGHLSTHGNPGETIIVADRGGTVAFSVYQKSEYQNQGKWGRNPQTGKSEQNDNWTIQYTFKGMLPEQVIKVVDADTGRQLCWPDGSPVQYTPSRFGDFSVELPKTTNADVRVQFVFDVFGSDSEQAQEIKVERGPNDRPNLKGENPLPGDVIKNRVLINGR